MTSHRTTEGQSVQWRCSSSSCYTACSEWEGQLAPTEGVLRTSRHASLAGLYCSVALVEWPLALRMLVQPLAWPLEYASHSSEFHIVMWCTESFNRAPVLCGLCCVGLSLEGLEEVHGQGGKSPPSQ